MTDVHSQETRSYNMSRIKAKDTKPELLVRKYLFCKGFRYRVNAKDLPGKPDIVLPKYKTVIFIHGCFGTATKGANILSSQRHVQNGGLKKSGKTRNGISRNTKPSEKRGGIL